MFQLFNDNMLTSLQVASITWLRTPHAWWSHLIYLRLIIQWVRKGSRVMRYTHSTVGNQYKVKVTGKCTSGYPYLPPVGLPTETILVVSLVIRTERSFHQAGHLPDSHSSVMFVLPLQPNLICPPCPHGDIFLPINMLIMLSVWWLHVPCNRQIMILDWQAPKLCPQPHITRAQIGCGELHSLSIAPLGSDGYWRY